MEYQLFGNCYEMVCWCCGRRICSGPYSENRMSMHSKGKGMRGFIFIVPRMSVVVATVPRSTGIASLYPRATNLPSLSLSV